MEQHPQSEYDDMVLPSTFFQTIMNQHVVVSTDAGDIDMFHLFQEEFSALCIKTPLL